LRLVPLIRLWLTFGAAGPWIQLQTPDFGLFSPLITGIVLWGDAMTKALDLLRPWIDEQFGDGCLCACASRSVPCCRFPAGSTLLPAPLKIYLPGNGWWV